MSLATRLRAATVQNDNNYEVCCYFVTAQVPLAVNTPQRAVTKKPIMLKYVWFLCVFLHHLIDQK